MPIGEYNLHIDHIAGDSLLQIEGDWKSLKTQLEAVLPLKRASQQKAPATRFRPETVYTCYSWNKALDRAETSKVVLSMYFSDNLDKGKISIILSPTLSESGYANEVQFHDILVVETEYKKQLGPNYWIDLPDSSIYTQDVLMMQIYQQCASGNASHRVLYGYNGVLASGYSYKSFVDWADREQPPWWKTVHAARLAEEERQRRLEEERRRKEEEARRAEEARKAAEEEAKRQARARAVMVEKPRQVLRLAPDCPDWMVEIYWKALMKKLHTDVNNGCSEDTRKKLTHMAQIVNEAHDKIKEQRGPDWDPNKLPWKENPNESSN